MGEKKKVSDQTKIDRAVNAVRAKVRYKKAKKEYGNAMQSERMTDRLQHHGTVDPDKVVIPKSGRVEIK